MMTRVEEALRAALTAATATVEPGVGTAARVSARTMRRRLRRRRVSLVAATALVTTAAAVGGPFVADQLSRPSNQPAPASGVIDGLCGPDTPAYGDILPPEDLPAGVRLLWAPDAAPTDILKGYSRYETGPCPTPELVLADVDAGVITRTAVIFGPEPAGTGMPTDAPDDQLPTEPGGVTFYEPEGPIYTEAGYLNAVWPVEGGQLRVRAHEFTEAELRELAAVTRIENGAVTLDGWSGASDIEHVDATGPMKATRTDWTIEGPQTALSVYETYAGGIMGGARVGDLIAEVNGHPALIHPGAKLGDFERATGTLVVWSPAEGVIAELSVATGLDPLTVANSVAPVADDDPRVQQAIQNWTDGD